MTTTLAAELADVRATWAQTTLEMHLSVCRARKAGRECLACDQLGEAAEAEAEAERAAGDAEGRERGAA